MNCVNSNELSARKVLFGAVAGLFLLGCDPATKNLGEWQAKIDTLRVEAQRQGASVPYRQEQHQAFKAYFREINELALTVKGDPTIASRFNQEIAKADLALACGKVLMPKAEWQAIVTGCTRNRFFLCAEEVRAYPEMVQAIREVLSADQKARFDSTPACQEGNPGSP